MWNLDIRHLRQQVVNAIEAGFFLVHRLHHPPGRFGNVGALQHHLFGRGVILPALAGLQVHGAELPLLERVMDTAQEARVLLFVGNREPVLDHLNTRAHQHFFELRHAAEKLFVLLVGTKTHHPLDSGAVVPTAVKQDHFASRREVRDVALEIPLRALAVIRCG